MKRTSHLPGAVLVSSLSSLLAATPRGALAEPLRWHFEGGAAHAVTTPQSDEYGFGAEGRLALEVPLARAVGVQVEGGGLWLAHAARPSDPSLADHGDGVAFFGMAGVRVRPFTEVAGPWADANLGYVRTGTLDRFGFDAHIGYDFRVGPEQSRWDVGPYVGYTEIVQPPDSLRPDDARVLAVGIHVALGAPRVVREAPASNAPPPPPPPPEPPPPPPPPAPPPDRDNDGVLDADDACPDVPGVHTDDPKTNGCPPAGDQVHVIRDRIEYDDVIHFDTDQAHVHHASYPILKKLAAFIVSHPDIEQVDITGHADERGSEEHNLALSKARAEAVRERLVQFGVDPARITTIGHGESEPRAAGHTENEWRQNRRVEFFITKVRNADGQSVSLPGNTSPSKETSP
jgi:OOP family OmpA-OmpF porin